MSKRLIKVPSNHIVVDFDLKGSESGKGIHLHYVEITEERNALLANTLNAQKHAYWEDGTVTLKLSESQVEYLEKVLLSYPVFGKEKENEK